MYVIKFNIILLCKFRRLHIVDGATTLVSTRRIDIPRTRTNVAMPYIYY